MPYKDPEKAKENAAKRSRTYRERHPDANREKSLAWYHRNKERAKAAHKKWVEKNREKLKAYRATRKAQEKAYAEKNHERILEYRRQWRARRKALKEGLAPPEPAKEQEVAVADFSKCRLCNAAGTVRFRKATANKPSGYNCGCSNPQCRAFLGSIGDVPKLHATMKEATDAWELFASGKADLLGTVFEWMQDEEDREERQDAAQVKAPDIPAAETPPAPDPEEPPAEENPEEPKEDIFADVEPDILEGDEPGEEDEDATPEDGEEDGMRDFDEDLNPEDIGEGDDDGEFPEDAEPGDEDAGDEDGEPEEPEDGDGEEDADEDDGEAFARFWLELDGTWYWMEGREDAESPCEGCAFCLAFGKRTFCAAQSSEDFAEAAELCKRLEGVWRKNEDGE